MDIVSYVRFPLKLNNQYWQIDSCSGPPRWHSVWRQSERWVNQILLAVHLDGILYGKDQAFFFFFNKKIKNEKVALIRLLRSKTQVSWFTCSGARLILDDLNPIQICMLLYLITINIILTGKLFPFCLMVVRMLLLKEDVVNNRSILTRFIRLFDFC